MAASEFDRCHAKDFCPLRDACKKWSTEGEGIVTSSQMVKGDMAWSRDRSGNYVFVVRSGLFASFVPYEDGCEHLFALFPRGIVSGVADLWVDIAAAEAYGLKCLISGVLCRVQADYAKAAFESRADALNVVTALLTNNSSCSLELTRILSEKETVGRLIRFFLLLREVIPGSKGRRVFHFTQNELAVVLAESRASIARAFNQLQALEAIKCGYGKVEVFYDKLPALAESAKVHSPFFYAE